MSAKFCRDAYNHTKIIILHGVTCKSGRGLPASIIQEELHNRKGQKKVRGTVISAELVGDSKCPSFISVYVYDIKPVHFLSMEVDHIKWTEKKIEVYDRSIGPMTTMNFHRLNVNNDYNYGMGGADIAPKEIHCSHWTNRSIIHFYFIPCPFDIIYFH